ncbi:unnamed protein product, partial [Ectocarpus sp. 12 AP-2014]
MEATAEDQHDDGTPVTGAERKAADARESELTQQTQQQQQCKSEGDGDEVDSTGAQVEYKDDAGLIPHVAEDMRGKTAIVTGQQDTTDGGHVGADLGDDQDGEPADTAGQTTPCTPEGKEQEKIAERATTDDVMVVDHMDRGKSDPPMSPQQQQQQQQQHTSPATDARDARVGNVGNSSGGAGGTASSRAPSVPPTPTWPEYCDPMYRMPEEIAVKVLVEGEVKEMSIKIERFEGTKVFQGGYRHKGAGRLFHHASTQFGQRERPVKNTDHLRTRDTQTCKIKTTTMQTTNECGTQV